MSLSVGGKREQQQQQQQTDPWAPAQPALRSVLSQLEGLQANPSDLTGVRSALQGLSGTLGSSNSGQALTQAGQRIGNANDYVPQAQAGYSDLQRRLSSTADGANQDLGKNTYLQSLLSQVGNDAQNRVNAQFAGAGRDMSGANNIEVGKGVTQAQLPLLLDQYNREVGRSDTAARDLYQGANTTATTSQALDTARSNLIGRGAELQQAGTTAAAETAGQRAQAEQLMAQLPYQQLGWLTELLYPAAGLGNQSQGTRTTTGSNWGFGARLY